jgi:nucleoside-triphosphatase THEP1
MSHIFIFSGPIHSGKTTWLENWIKNAPTVDGILAPVINGRRHLKYILSGEIYLLETDSPNPESYLQIGNYKFLNSEFQKAKKYLLNLINNPPNRIIVDEIGFLELDGQGYEPAVSQLINNLDANSNVNIILVVRDTLKAKVIDYFKLDVNSIRDFIPE